MHALHRQNWTVAVFTVVMVGMFVYQSTAMRPAAPSRPAVLATVNLEVVFESLSERVEADAGLEQLAEELKQQADTLANELDLLKEDLELYAKGSANHQQALEKYSLKSLEYQAFVEFSRRKIEIKKAQSLKRIYRSIKDTSAVLAAEHGYDVVFVDDSVAAMASGTEADVNRQISARRMLYVNPELDVTRQLIERMNGQ